MKKVIKAVALFIGTVVGAGLASGKEIAVYFNGLNPLTTIFSGVFLGFFCSLFMFSLSICRVVDEKPRKSISDVVVVV